MSRSRPIIDPDAVQRLPIQGGPPDLCASDPEAGAPVQRCNVLGHRALLLRRVLPPRSCRRLIQWGEAQGFAPAGLAIGQDHYRTNTRARNNERIIFEDRALADWLWRRFGSKLPARAGWRPVGLNWRFRFYRYLPGTYFRAHVDVQMTLPGRPRDEVTRSSLLLYLNEDCHGGETTFFEKNAGRRGRPPVVAAIRPETGAVAVFDHLLLHEGAEVERGRKYALRSDVIYSRRR